MIERKITTALQVETAGVQLPADLRDRIKRQAAASASTAPVHSHRRRRPAVKWVAAAALALLAVGAVDWSRGNPAMAALLRTLGFAQVRELDQLQMEEYQATSQEQYDLTLQMRATPPDEDGRYYDQDGRVIGMRATVTTFDEVQQAVAYRLVKPTYMTEGYKPGLATYFKGDPHSSVTLTYDGRGSIVVRQWSPASGNPTYYDLPEGVAETVLVAGEPAVLFRGTWGVEPDGVYKWTDGSPVTLLFTHQGRHMSISAGVVGFPAEELIRIAESLQ